MTFLNDPIKVICSFELGQPSPLSFEWHCQQYDILQTVFRFRTAQGSETLLIFSCQTQSGVFDLVFNLKTLSWRLKDFHQPA